MSTGRGKVVAIISGAVVIGTLVSVAVLWKDFAVRYHLHRLRSTPDYFFEIVDRPEGSAGRLAVESFAESDQGAKFILSTLLAHFKRAEEEENSRLSEVEIGIVGFGDPAKLKADEPPGLWYSFIFKKVSRRGQSRVNPSRKAETQRHVAMHPAMVRLLPKVPGHEWILPDHPGLRFTVLTADAGFDRLLEAARQKWLGVNDVGTDFEKFPLVILIQRVLPLQDS
jgi:hypothetical protein